MVIKIGISTFGQKTRPPTVALQELVDFSAVYDLTAHVGIDILPKNTGDTLLWSRNGLQDMVLRGGDLYPSMSLIHSANLIVKPQDSLAVEEVDLRVDLAGDLSKCCTAKLIYLQFYNTNPCYRPKEYHAISGLFVSGGCLHHQVSKQFFSKVIVFSTLRKTYY